jgi:hypothetical protein
MTRFLPRLARPDLSEIPAAEPCSSRADNHNFPLPPIPREFPLAIDTTRHGSEAVVQFGKRSLGTAALLGEWLNLSHPLNNGRPLLKLRLTLSLK